jgi:hypothetical protein
MAALAVRLFGMPSSSCRKPGRGKGTPPSVFRVRDGLQMVWIRARAVLA